MHNPVCGKMAGVEFMGGVKAAVELIGGYIGALKIGWCSKVSKQGLVKFWQLAKHEFVVISLASKGMHLRSYTKLCGSDNTNHSVASKNICV